MSMEISASSSDSNRIVAVLRDAEEDDELVRAALRDPDNQTYVATIADVVVGAAVVRWGDGTTSELLYLGLDSEHRGRGHGRRILEHLMSELPEHGRRLV